MTDAPDPPVADSVFGFWSSRPFKGAKTPAVLHAETRLHEDWLFIASLDEAVVSIHPPGGAAPAHDFEVVGADNRRQLVFLVPQAADPARRSSVLSSVAAADKAGDECRVVEEAEVLREPRLRNARLVFGCRKVRVSPTDRLQILHHLGQHSGRSNLLETSECVRTTPEAAECVLALVTEGTVMVDVERTLGPEMPVWRVRTEADEDEGY